MTGSAISPNVQTARRTAAPSPQVIQVTLLPREVLAFDGDLRGVQIVSVGAVLWATQDGDPEDYILARGECFTVTRPGRVVLQGMRPQGLTYSL